MLNAKTLAVAAIASLTQAVRVDCEEDWCFQEVDLGPEVAEGLTDSNTSIIMLIDNTNHVNYPPPPVSEAPNPVGCYAYLQNGVTDVGFVHFKDDGTANTSWKGNIGSWSQTSDEDGSHRVTLRPNASASRTLGFATTPDGEGLIMISPIKKPPSAARRTDDSRCLD